MIIHALDDQLSTLEWSYRAIRAATNSPARFKVTKGVHVRSEIWFAHLK